MRLIDADALVKALNEAQVEFDEYYKGLGRAKVITDDAPTIEERPKGEWIGDTDLDNTCKCSECRMTFDTDRLKMVMLDGKYELPPYCPNCGAQMYES